MCVTVEWAGITQSWLLDGGLRCRFNDKTVWLDVNVGLLRSLRWFIDATDKSNVDVGLLRWFNDTTG